MDNKKRVVSMLCDLSKEWFGYYVRNMNYVGLEAKFEHGVSDTIAHLALGKTLLEVIQTYGKNVKAKSLKGKIANGMIKGGNVVMGGYVAYYFGAAIGSAFMATMLVKKCGVLPAFIKDPSLRHLIKYAEVEDVVEFAKVHKVYFAGLSDILHSHAEIWDLDFSGERRNYVEKLEFHAIRR